MDRRVEVIWLDSGLQYSQGWECKDHIIKEKLSDVATCGYLFYEDEEAVYVSLSRDTANGNYYGTQVIAKQNIKKIKYLRERGAGNSGT